MGKGDTFLNALIGAVVTLVLSFTGFSPVLGGAVAGYLQRESRRSGAKVGGLSGAFAFIPFLFIASIFFGIFFGGTMAGGMGMPGGPELLIIFFIMFPLFLAWNVGLGALGGYLGTVIREDVQETSH